MSEDVRAREQTLSPAAARGVLFASERTGPIPAPAAPEDAELLVLKRLSSRAARAIDFALEHDDGQNPNDLDDAEVIVIAPSRCGKTPTSMYLALQYGLRVANHPMTEEDVVSGRLPRAVLSHLGRCIGLTSNARRLSQVRHERRIDSRYASVEQCALELRQAEELYARNRIPFLNSATASVEEISVAIWRVVQERARTTPAQ